MGEVAKAVMQEAVKALDTGQDLAMELLLQAGGLQLQLVEKLSSPRMELLQGAGATTPDTRCYKKGRGPITWATKRRLGFSFSSCLL